MPQLFSNDATPREILAHDAMDAMMRVQRQHHRLIEQHRGSVGLHRSQYRLLMAVACMDGPLSQREISDHLGITPAAVSRTLTTLEEAGLIQKLEADGRRNEIVILPAGQAQIDRTQRLFRGVDNRMFEGVDEDELKTLTAILERIRENLEHMDAESPAKGDAIDL